MLQLVNKYHILCIIMYYVYIMKYCIITFTIMAKRAKVRMIHYDFIKKMHMYNTYIQARAHEPHQRFSHTVYMMCIAYAYVVCVLCICEQAGSGMNVCIYYQVCVCMHVSANCILSGICIYCFVKNQYTTVSYLVPLSCVRTCYAIIKPIINIHKVGIHRQTDTHHYII